MMGDNNPLDPMMEPPLMVQTQTMPTNEQASTMNKMIRPPLISLTKPSPLFLMQTTPLLISLILQVTMPVWAKTRLSLKLDVSSVSEFVFILCDSP